MNLEPIVYGLLFLIVVLVVFSVIVWRLTKDVREQVERALRESADDDEMQAEIRKKVVKAVFPPRFYRD